MTRARIFAGLLALLIVGTAGAVLSSSRWTHPVGDMMTLFPIDSDRAVLWLRASGDHPPSSLSLVDASGAVHWTEPLEGFPIGNVDVQGQTVLVQLERSGGDASGIVIQGYDVATGRRRWETEARAPTAPRSIDSVVDERDLVMLYENDEVVAIDVATGALRWRGSIESFSSAHVRLTAEHAIVESTSGVDFFARDTGAHTHLATRGVGCTDGGAYLALVRRGEEVALVAAEPDAPEQARTIDDAIDLEIAGGARPGLSLACGIYGSLAVFTVEFEPLADGGPRGVAVLAIDRRSGETMFTLPLDAASTARPYETPRSAGTASDPLPRFLPVVAIDDGHPPEWRIAMIDLGRGEIARPGAHAHVVTCDVMPATARYSYLGGHCPLAERLVAVLDGETGTVAGARSTIPIRVAQPPPGADVIWVHGDTWDFGEAAPWVVLDVATLAPRSEPRIALEDARDELAATLGLDGARAR